jgi:hypothetical protein
MSIWWSAHRHVSLRLATLFLLSAGLTLIAPVMDAQQLDICGCATIPNLQPFDSANPATFPPGTSDNGTALTLTIPADGVFRFSSFTITNRQVSFVRNAANSPVTILVAGDATLNSTQGCCFSFTVAGSGGSNGNGSFAGVGGLGGPGGFRGGDGASQGINGAAIGGAGFGPGGGAGGTPAPLAGGGGGTFLGVPELTPLLGGSGGGGGSSSANDGRSCSGGGGGGGGGGLLIAANGTLTISGYQVFADGANPGGGGDGGCSTAGGGGSGGAIRFVASSLVAGNSVGIFARAASNSTDGRLRFETIDTTAQTAFSTQPAALRIVGPTPLANPITPTVAITAIGGSALTTVPQGTYGSIDVVLPAPGATTVSIATSGVPGGTTVAVTVKPRIGGQPVSQTAPLTNCDNTGACDTVTTFNLAAGAYVIEARATFQVP